MTKKERLELALCIKNQDMFPLYRRDAINLSNLMKMTIENLWLAKAPEDNETEIIREATIHWNNTGELPR